MRDAGDAASANLGCGITDFTYFTDRMRVFAYCRSSIGARVRIARVPKKILPAQGTTDHRQRFSFGSPAVGRSSDAASTGRNIPNDLMRA